MQRLQNIFVFISKDDSIAAIKLIGKIFKRIETLTNFPERGRKVLEANREEIREFFESGYRIIYRVESKRVSVLSIRNFRQAVPDKELK